MKPTHFELVRVSIFEDDSGWRNEALIRLLDSSGRSVGELLLEQFMSPSLIQRMENEIRKALRDFAQKEGIEERKRRRRIR